MNNRFSQLKIRALCIFFAFIILLLIETACRVFYNENRHLYRIIEILDQDADLIWRQRPALKTIFHGALIETNSMGLREKEFSSDKDGKTRIVCMGASPTFGWGVEKEDRYSDQIETILNNKYTGDFEVINAGQIGFTSHQGLIFLKNYILTLKPDILTISYVVNDVDKFRFFRSNGKEDKELEPQNRFMVTFENMLSRSYLVKVLSKLIHIKTGDAAEESLDPATNDNKRRVSARDYRDNLEKFSDIARQNGIAAVFVKMPINNPFDGKTRPEKHFDEKKKEELMDCIKYVGEYNRTMQEFTDQNNLPLVDAAARFNEIPGAEKDRLFNAPGHDLVHPSPAGHRIIAREIIDTLKLFDIIREK